MFRASEVKLGASDPKGFYLERNGFDPIRCDYEATYGWQGFGKAKRKVRYPAGAIRVYIGAGFVVGGLDAAKAKVAADLNRQVGA